MNNLKKHLKCYPRADVLDVGTGYGDFIAMMTKIYDEYSTITGIDVSEKAILEAQKLFTDTRIKFRVLDALKTDYADETFDIVSFSNSLHHLKSLQPLFNEIERLLKPNGMFIVNEMMNDHLTPSQESHKRLHHFAAAIDRENGQVHDETLSRKQIVDVIQTHTSLSFSDHWDMVQPSRDVHQKERIQKIEEIIDILLNRAEHSDKFSSFVQEAKALKTYIHKHGYDHATQTLVVLKKY